jgi:hypothetical protein
VRNRLSAVIESAITNIPIEVLAAVDAQDVTRLLELDVLESLVWETDFARYWQPPDKEDLWFADPAIVATLSPIVEAVLTCDHARWWSAPMDPTCQS